MFPVYPYFEDSVSKLLILSILSYVITSGSRGDKRWSWRLARVVAAITIILSSSLIAVAATLTGGFKYPGLAIVLLVIVNDTIIAEVGVLYFLTKPETKASLGEKPILRVTNPVTVPFGIVDNNRAVDWVSRRMSAGSKRVFPWLLLIR